MLVLSRKVGETLVIGDNITLRINKISGNRVTVGIEAPGNVRILRGELAEVATQFELGESNSRQADFEQAESRFEDAGSEVDSYQNSGVPLAIDSGTFSMSARYAR